MDCYNDNEHLGDFNKWFSLFLEEKELNDTILEFEDARQWHFVPIGIIREFLATAPLRSNKI